STGQTVVDRNSDSDLYPLTFSGPGPHRALLLNRTGGTVDFDLRFVDVASAPLVALNTPVSGNVGPRQTIAFRVNTADAARVFYDGIGTDFNNVSGSLFSPIGGNYGQFQVDSDSNVFTTFIGGTQYVLITNNTSSTDGFTFILRDLA